MRFKTLLEQHHTGIDGNEVSGLEALEMLMRGPDDTGSNMAERQPTEEMQQGGLGSHNQSQILGTSLNWNNSQNFFLNMGGPSLSQLWPLQGQGLNRADSLVSRKNSRQTGRNSNPPENLNFLMQSRVNSREGGTPITRQNSVLDCLRQLERFNSIANLNQGQERQIRPDAFQFYDSRRVSQAFQIPGFGQEMMQEEKITSRMPSFKSPTKYIPNNPVEVLLPKTISFDGKSDRFQKLASAQNQVSRLKERRRLLCALRKQPSKQVLVRIETKKHLQKEVQRQYVQCVCKKTKCLKLYCICFKNGITCSDLCDCTGCLNKGTGIQPSESVSKQRQFRQKVLNKIKERKEVPNPNCCNCRKSFCQNRYCKCFLSGHGCGPDCTCLACKNRKPT